MSMQNKRKYSYLWQGLLWVMVGLIGGWYTRRVWQPPVDMIGPASQDLLINVGIYISYFTSPILLLAVSLVAAFWAVETHHTYAWLHIALAILAATAVSYIGKSLLELSRPSGGLLELNSHGFPSTHATVSGTVLTAGVFQLKRLYKKYNDFLLLPFSIAVSAILISRVLVGVHTVSDIGGGLLVGVGIGMISLHVWSTLLPGLRLEN